MRGLIIKDLINLKKNIRIYLVFIVLYGVLAYMQEDAAFFGSIFTLLFSLLTITTYSYDELAKWDEFALSTPVSRDAIVKSKYIIMILLIGVGAGVSLLFTVVLNSILKKDNLITGGEICLAVAAISILYYTIIIPIITKKGSEKARLIFIAIYMIPFMIGLLTKKMLEKGEVKIPAVIIRGGEIFLQHIYLIVPAILIVAVAISYVISLGIYRKKEF